MTASWAKAGAVIGLIMGIKRGGVAIISGPIIFAAMGASFRRWLFIKFGI